MTLLGGLSATGRFRARRVGRNGAGRLITVSGIDCAGKTTQLDLLERGLRDASEDVVRFWLRPGYSPELDQLRSLVRRALPRVLPAARDTGARGQAFRRPHVRKTWINIALVDLLVQYGGKVRALLVTGHTVLCDRYIQDAFLDLELRFPDFDSSRHVLARAAARATPAPDHAFLLHVSRDEMLRRMSIKREPFPDDEATRDARYDAYLRFPQKHGLTLIDASRPPEEVHQDIVSRLGVTEISHARG